MRQVPTAVVAKPLVEKLFVRKPVCVRDGSGMETALRVGDVRENQIQNGAVTLGKIRAVPVEADEEKCSRPFIISKHSRQFAVHAKRAIEDVVKLSPVKRAA